jgi:glycosyltransferase involved in cell wall biosynthesis
MSSYRDPLPRLRRAIDSVLGQTIADLELLVAFEPADENAAAISQAYHDPRLIVVENQRRSGKAQSFNACIDRARGRYIARMDSDDYALAHRLDLQLAFLNNHPEVAILGGGVNIVDEEGRLLATRIFPTDHHEIVKSFALMSSVSHPTIIWDQRKLGNHGRYDPAFSVEDLELWFRLLGLGYRFANLAEPLIEYKQTDLWRRPRRHWLGNLRVRAVYWRLTLRHPTFLAGLIAFAFLAFMPKPVIDRLTQRSRFSDFIRSIRPARPYRSK